MIKLNRVYIKKTMAAYGWTQTRLSQETGMDCPQISRLLSKGRCLESTGQKIADALGVELEEICESWE